MATAASNVVTDDEGGVAGGKDAHSQQAIPNIVTMNPSPFPAAGPFLQPV
eukprot:CAMPEP_0179450452 /NCGR_PEP_ID=MMETSP0799-20121207/34408_1 /TAXON_ID=46947 /ORGANISM="Geminigera cryophila, Strain CCMP2564" /LENGTH=49 /DNA_ID= /DNA_START= /DNA_END= /DNA_ORIENTATION=